MGKKPLVEPDLWNLSFRGQGLWYVWAIDSSGVSDPMPIWVDVQQVGYNPGPDLVQVCDKLQEILLSHIPGINASIQQVFHADAGLKVVHFGSATALREFPSILITNPRVQVDWVAFPMVREFVFTVDILAIILHQDQASVMPIATHMAGWIMEILNNPIYDQISLPNDTRLAFCMASSGDSMEAKFDEKYWSGVASIAWSGKALAQPTMLSH